MRDLQSAAFGGPKKSKKKKGGNNSSSLPASEQQFEEWVERDKVIVDDNFEQQMQAAIRQSKIEAEQRKELVEANGAICELNGDLNEEGKSKKKANKATKKSNVMSLDEFRNPEAVKVPPPPVVEAHISSRGKGKSETPDTDFFEELDAATTKALT